MTAKIRIVWGGREAYSEEEQQDGLIPFDSFGEIPSFASHEEEAAWFDTHRPSSRLLEDAIRRDCERRARGGPEPPALRRLRELVPARPLEPRIYPPGDEGKRIVEPDEVPAFASGAERDAYWQTNTLSRAAPAKGGRGPRP
jgi:hypothetical protein